MVARAKRPEMDDMVALLDLRILFRNFLEPGFQARPQFRHGLGRLLPSAYVALLEICGTAVWHTRLDGAAQLT